jgi:membrane protease YdiL (CAAX protease family)
MHVDPLDRRSLREEVLIVLSLTVLYSAVLALIDLLSAPIKGVSVVTAPQTLQLTKQLTYFVFGLAPVWLALYLVRRSDGAVRSIGLDGDEPAGDAIAGVLLAIVVAGIGLGVYAAAVGLGLNRFVIPVPPLGHWWTIPVLVLTAAQNGLLEEIVVVGYLLTRLERMGWTPARALWASALLRGSYHLYQGFGGFAGNVVLGLFFGWLFQRSRRLWPLVIAHTLVDVLAGLGYILLRDKVGFI